MNSWSICSKKEKVLADEISLDIINFSGGRIAYDEILFELAHYVINHQFKTAHLLDNKLEQIFRKHPQLLNIDLKSTFPQTKDSLTSNFFSQLAYEIEKKEYAVDKSGSYFTPSILAKDMVKLALANWVSRNLNIELTQVLKQLNCEGSLDSKIKNNIKDLKWYDPCVGTGIFPIEILLLYKKLHIPLTMDIASNIYASDINPLFVMATRIRIALLINDKDRDFTKTINSFKKSYVCKNSLDSNSEQANLINPENQILADIVIGNPPYVRSNKIDKDQKKILQKSYFSISNGTPDLYAYFIAHGLNICKKLGCLCYVSPATFQRNSNGSSIRKYINKNASVDILFDFDELPVFEGISSHISVYILTKNEKQSEVKFALYDHLPTNSPLLIGIKKNIELSPVSISQSGWILNTNDARVVDLMMLNSIPLKSYVENIYSGIKTGLKDAYEIDKTQYNRFKSDGLSHKYLYKEVLPKEIKRWRFSPGEKYIILSKRGEKLPLESEVYRHFLTYKDQLLKRSDLKENHEWYNLRDCNYYDLFGKPKIVYPDISSTNKFALDLDGHIILDGAFFIPSGDLFLLGLLNTKIALLYFKSKCASIGNTSSRGRIRFKKVYVSNFPIPIINSANEHIKHKIIKLVKELLTKYDEKKELELDNLAIKLYKVPVKYYGQITNSK